MMGCHCYWFWIECQSQYDLIQELVPSNYAWENDAIRIQLNNSRKKYNLFKSITKQLFKNAVPSPVPKVIYIHCYPFLIPMLEWPSCLIMGHGKFYWKVKISWGAQFAERISKYIRVSKDLPMKYLNNFFYEHEITASERMAYELMSS